MDSDEKLTKAQKRELRKLEWEQKAQSQAKTAQYKKIGLWIGVTFAVILGIFGLAMIVNSPTTSSGGGLQAPAPTKEDIYTKGNPNSKVVVVEYGDYQCPACAQYQPIVKALLEEYKDKVYFVYRDFPLINSHQNAHISARAAFAANKQGKFWEMYDALYENQTEWATNPNAETIFTNYASNLGLNADKFKNDLNSNEAKSFVDNALSNATSIGLNSTPSFFINGSKIENPSSYDELKALIDNELNKE
ncbi:MAG: DsbA family protein [Candidatus Levybacteria bacterium]|nr:DsbA family protein [Candidatus Levybacteria bacterium]